REPGKVRALGGEFAQAFWGRFAGGQDHPLRRAARSLDQGLDVTLALAWSAPGQASFRQRQLANAPRNSLLLPRRLAHFVSCRGSALYISLATFHRQFLPPQIPPDLSTGENPKATQAVILVVRRK